MALFCDITSLLNMAATAAAATGWCDDAAWLAQLGFYTAGCCHLALPAHTNLSAVRCIIMQLLNMIIFIKHGEFALKGIFVIQKIVWFSSQETNKTSKPLISQFLIYLCQSGNNVVCMNCKYRLLVINLH